MNAPPLRAAERHPAEWIENDGLLRDEGVLFGLTEPGAAEAWKVRLTEFGMPTVAALFAVTWGGARPWPQAATAFAFLMLVFLVAGRLALSGVPALWQALRVDRERRAEALAARTARAALTDEHERLRVALHAPTSDEALDRRCDERKALFLSEVALARAARGTFGENIGARVRLGGMADGVGGGVSGDGSADFEVPDFNTPDLGANDLGAPDEDAPTTDDDTVA